jgi:hypothetical protein
MQTTPTLFGDWLPARERCRIDSLGHAKLETHGSVGAAVHGLVEPRTAEERRGYRSSP